ncbi:hypothetical protein [Mumia sp. Pv 4-285]|uniref:hypothetical protein n=1 Tax=Mumia qirimensis TaxID=3234852 RepID=UPI00351CF7D8
MRVESHDRFSAVAEFDPVTGRLDEFSRASGAAADRVAPQGHYSRLAGTLVVFYRLGASLWIRIGVASRNLDDAGVEIRWKRSRGHSTLDLIDNGVLVAEAEYQPGPGGGDADPTPFAESEDWDFGLFVNAVLGSEGRRARIYGGAGGYAE